MTCQLWPVLNLRCPQRRLQQLRRQFHTPKIYHLPQTQLARDLCCRSERKRMTCNFQLVRQRAYPPQFQQAVPSVLSKRFGSSAVRRFGTTNMTAKPMIAHSTADMSTYQGGVTDTDVARVAQKETTRPVSPSAGDTKPVTSLNSSKSKSKSRDQILASASDSFEEELAVAALLAHLSSLAYYSDPSEHLRALGLTLVATGETAFTSFYIADGPDPSTCRYFHPPPPSPPDPSTSNRPSTTPMNGSHSSQHEQPSDNNASAKTGIVNGEGMMRMTRFVITRGVAWSRPSVDSQLLWRQLSKFWPITIEIPANQESKNPIKNPINNPIENSVKKSGGSVVAHAGIKEIADQIYGLITPHLAVDLPQKGISTVRFGGHSMGGSVALILLTRLQKEGGLKFIIKTSGGPCGDDTWRAVPGVSVHTFGSPPVLASVEGQTEGEDSWTSRLMPRWTNWTQNQSEVNNNKNSHPQRPSSPYSSSFPSSPSPSSSSSSSSFPPTTATPSPPLSQSSASEIPSTLGDQYLGGRSRSETALASSSQSQSGGTNMVLPPGSETPFRGVEGLPPGTTSSALPPVTIPVFPPDSPSRQISDMGRRLSPQTASEPLPATLPTCGIQNVLGLPCGSLQAYVHDQDIVARAGLAADPLYGLAMKIGLVKAALELRERVLGSGGVLSAERFLFQTAGEVHFMRTKGPRVIVSRLEKSEADVVLKMDAGELISRPVSLVKTVTDHSHQGYADGLRLALAFKSRWTGQGGRR